MDATIRITCSGNQVILSRLGAQTARSWRWLMLVVIGAMTGAVTVPSPLSLIYAVDIFLYRAVTMIREMIDGLGR